MLREVRPLSILSGCLLWASLFALAGLFVASTGADLRGASPWSSAAQYEPDMDGPHRSGYTSASPAGYMVESLPMPAESEADGDCIVRRCVATAPQLARADIRHADAPASRRVRSPGRGPPFT